MRFNALAAAAITAAAVISSNQAYALDTAKIGYGQGTAVDSENRPVDAAEFNNRYGDLDACALSEEKNRIILTFDQGYENGYTAKILDTLKEKNVSAIFSLQAIMPKRKQHLFSE